MFSVLPSVVVLVPGTGELAVCSLGPGSTFGTHLLFLPCWLLLSADP